jgi:urease beta subunit
MAEMKPAAKTMWKQLCTRGFFREPADGIPITVRKLIMNDVSNAGRQRRTWEERGGFMSKDALIRKEMFESTKRSGEALFTHGTEQLNAFLRERSQSGLSDADPRQLQNDEEVHLLDLNEMSIERRKALHSKVDVVSHDGVKFIPSAHKRVELFLRNIRNNKVEEVEEFLNGTYGKIDANDKDSRTGCTALIEAAQSGHKRILKMLIKSKASVDAQDRKGNTALHYATTYKYQAIVEYLVHHGADLSICNSKAKSCLEGI